MAEPIALKLASPDPREALYHRLENAPREHVEALLASYEVLQGLHDRGVLELVRGALGSSDKVLQILVDAVNTREALCGIRNLMILVRIAGTMEPELLEALAMRAGRPGTGKNAGTTRTVATIEKVEQPRHPPRYDCNDLRIRIIGKKLGWTRGWTRQQTVSRHYEVFPGQRASGPAAGLHLSLL